MVVAKPGSAFIAPADLDSLSGAYPLAPAVLRHGLADHPLLTLSALADAASEMPAEHVERRIADAVNAGDFALAPAAHAHVQSRLPASETRLGRAAVRPMRWQAL